MKQPHKMTQSELLEMFLLHPTVKEVNEEYLWKPRWHSSLAQPRVFEERSIAQYLERFIHEYFKRLGDTLISPDVAQQFVQLAETFAQRGYGHCEYTKNAAACIEMFRLRTLIDHPTFLADECAVSVLLKLKDVEHCEPWGFEMFANYDDRDLTGYHIRWGFGTRNIPSFHRMILCGDLWTGKSQEMRRVFFSSVGQALQLMSRDQGLLLETLQARIDLLRQNKELGGHHEPWCNTSFRKNELEALRRLVDVDQRAHSGLEQIEIAPYMVSYPHCC